jgi:hypothetical protein
VNGDLARALAAGNGILRRSDARLATGVIEYALRAGQLRRLHRGVYAAALDAAKPSIRWRAALRYLGGSAHASFAQS